MNWTSIGWTDLSSNALKYRDNSTGKNVWACVKTSPGCKNCYAESLGLRYQRGGPFTRANLATVTPYMDRSEIHHILNAKVIKKIPVAGKRCFSFDMTDLFGDWVTDEMIDQAFAAFACRKDLTFQILTKRPERMRDYTAALYRDIASVTVPRLRAAANSMGFGHLFATAFPGPVFETPIENIWLGTSIENLAMLRLRAPVLAEVRTPVRFWSVEPLIEDIGDEVAAAMARPVFPDLPPMKWPLKRSVDWIVVGAESGPNRRPMPAAWAAEIASACARLGVPLFVKQLEVAGKITTKTNEFPPWLRFQEFPT